MTFEKALEAMRDGKKVTKKSWANKYWLWLPEENIGTPVIYVHFVNKNTSQIWEPNAFVLADNDWEVADETTAITMDKMTKIINKNMENAAREIFGEKLLNVDSCVESFGYECCSKPEYMEIKHTTIVYLDHAKN